MSKSKIKMAKKPKIAVLVNAFWNSGAGISGGDQRVIQIFKRIGKEFQIDIYTSRDGAKIIQKEIKDAVLIISPKSLEKGNVLLKYHKRSKWLIAEIQKRKYDIVYSSSDFFPDVTPAYNYKKNYPKTKWISCIFHIYPDWRKRPGNKIVNLIGTTIQKESLKKIGKLADKVININYQVRDELVKKFHFDNKKIVINPCGIDLDYFKSIKAKKKPNQACFLARLVPSKGIFDLAEIWSGVVKKVPAAKLKIIGGGSNEIKLKLKNAFEQKGIEKNVEVLGFLENDKAYKILKESFVFIFPSHEEGFGIAIAEAFACGVPVVAWDLPVYAEVFPKSVLTAEIGNQKKMADHIVELLTNEAELKKFLQLGQNVIEQYSWERVAFEEYKIINALKNEK